MEKTRYSLIAVNEDGKRYIIYDYDGDQKLKLGTIGYTTIKLPNEKIEEIKNVTLDKLDQILSNYI